MHCFPAIKSVTRPLKIRKTRRELIPESTVVERGVCVHLRTDGIYRLIRLAAAHNPILGWRSGRVDKAPPPTADGLGVESGRFDNAGVKQANHANHPGKCRRKKQAGNFRTNQNANDAHKANLPGNSGLQNRSPVFCASSA